MSQRPPHPSPPSTPTPSYRERRTLYGPYLEVEVPVTEEIEKLKQAGEFHELDRLACVALENAGWERQSSDTGPYLRFTYGHSHHPDTATACTLRYKEPSHR